MSELSEKVTALSKEYLGPATQAFLSRRCKEHLKIEFNDLTAADLKALAKCVEVSAGLIMAAEKASEVARKIAACK